MTNKLGELLLRIKRRLNSPRHSAKDLVKVCIRTPEGSTINRWFNKEAQIFTLAQSLALTYQLNQKTIRFHRNGQLLSNLERFGNYDACEPICLDLVHADTNNRGHEYFLCHGTNKTINQINFFHMRKTGGTSLRHYVDVLAENKSVHAEIVEGYSINSSEYFSDSDRKLFIISLREPIQRIKSSYLFEGRWTQLAETKRFEEAKSFSRWVEDVNNQPESKLWQCVSNYYIKSLIGYPEHGRDGISEKEFEMACNILKRFDLILITEWMNSEKTLNYLRKTLEFDFSVPFLKPVIRVENPQEEESELFDSKTIQKIQNDNIWDCRLYELAKTIVDDRCSAV